MTTKYDLHLNQPISFQDLCLCLYTGPLAPLHRYIHIFQTLRTYHSSSSCPLSSPSVAASLSCFAFAWLFKFCNHQGAGDTCSSCGKSLVACNNRKAFARRAALPRLGPSADALPRLGPSADALPSPSLPAALFRSASTPRLSRAFCPFLSSAIGGSVMSLATLAPVTKSRFNWCVTVKTNGSKTIPPGKARQSSTARDHDRKTSSTFRLAQRQAVAPAP